MWWCENVSRRDSTARTSSVVKVPDPSPTGVQTASLTAATLAVTSNYRSSIGASADDVLSTKDLLRILAEVNFIYGEVKRSLASLVKQDENGLHEP